MLLAQIQLCSCGYSQYSTHYRFFLLWTTNTMFIVNLGEEQPLLLIIEMVIDTPFHNVCIEKIDIVILCMQVHRIIINLYPKERCKLFKHHHTFEKNILLFFSGSRLFTFIELHSSTGTCNAVFTCFKIYQGEKYTRIYN